MNQDVDPYDYDLLLDSQNEGKNAFIGVVKFDKEESSAENGLCIEKLFISPYQMVVFSKTPENNSFYETAAFDQDGKKIRFEEIGDKPGEFASEIFALRERELSKVHIYVTQNQDNMIKMHLAETEAEAEKLSEKDFWVDIAN